MLSAIVDGKVLDFKYKKLQSFKSGNQYAFYVGDILVGQVFKMRFGWSSVVTFSPNTSVGVVEGFITRTAASQYILQCVKLRLKNIIV